MYRPVSWEGVDDEVFSVVSGAKFLLPLLTFDSLQLLACIMPSLPNQRRRVHGPLKSRASFWVPALHISWSRMLAQCLESHRSFRCCCSLPSLFSPCSREKVEMRERKQRNVKERKKGRERERIGLAWSEKVG